MEAAVPVPSNEESAGCSDEVANALVSTSTSPPTRPSGVHIETQTTKLSDRREATIQYAKMMRAMIDLFKERVAVRIASTKTHLVRHDIANKTQNRDPTFVEGIQAVKDLLMVLYDRINEKVRTLKQRSFYLLCEEGQLAFASAFRKMFGRFHNLAEKINTLDKAQHTANVRSNTTTSMQCMLEIESAVQYVLSSLHADINGLEHALTVTHSNEPRTANGIKLDDWTPLFPAPNPALRVPPSPSPPMYSCLQ